MKPTLEFYRNKIDKLDAEIVKLLNDRIGCAIEVGKIKTNDFLMQEKIKADNGDVNPSSNSFNLYRPEREAQILSKIKQHNKGPIPNELLASLYKEIMSISLSLESPLKISYLGPEGTFSHLASVKQFGKPMKYFAADTIEQVFKMTENNLVDLGVVPIENSTSGMIHLTQDCLMNTNCNITNQIELNIEHHLLSHANSLGDIKTVYAHPQALAQCKNWLVKKLPQARQQETVSNTAGAKKAQENITDACISSVLAARLYDLNILESNIEDFTGNTTRFYVIGKSQLSQTTQDKTVLFFSVKQEAGSLLKVLQSLSDEGINMTSLTSRPSPNSFWDYVFFVECEGHFSQPEVVKAVAKMKNSCLHLKVLGSFPLVSSI